MKSPSNGAVALHDLNPFRPAWWLPGPHLPTLWAALTNPGPNPDVRVERLQLSDGDFLDLCWVGGDSGPLVVLMHGLEGSVNSNYAVRISNKIAKAGWGAVFMHFRGCSGEPNRQDRSYHSGETEDFRNLVSILRKREPKRQIMALGYSLGGNVLLKYLGESGEQAPLAAAAAISPPFELAAGANRLNRGASKLYQRHLIDSLHGKVRQKFASRAAPISLDKLRHWRDFRSFDDHVTAPLHGFIDAEEYYAQSSCRQYLPAIKVQTLIIHSRDDPFLSSDAIPASEELSTSTHLVLTNRGGHVGFVAGRIPFKADYWLDEQLMAWLRASIK